MSSIDNLHAIVDSDPQAFATGAKLGEYIIRTSDELNPSKVEPGSDVLVVLAGGLANLEAGEDGTAIRKPAFLVGAVAGALGYLEDSRQ